MKLLALVLTIFAVAPSAAGGTPPRASLPDVEDEVMCVECGTALNVSQSAVADQERAFIRRQIALGKDKAQIKAALVDQFGPGVLAMPEEKGFSLAAYLVPIGLAAAALLALVLTARRWRRRPAARPPAATAPLADEDARRLDAELAAYDRR